MDQGEAGKVLSRSEAVFAFQQAVVAHEDDHGVVEHRAVAFLRRGKLLQEAGEERDVEGVDFRHAGDFFRVVAVVGERVVRLADADLGVAAVAGLAGELEGDDAGDISLHGEQLQIKHEPCVLGVAGWYPRGPGEIG